MNRPEQVCSHRPLDAFRRQARQCQQALVEEKEVLYALQQRFTEEDISLVNKTLCNKVLFYLAHNKEVLQTLQACFDEARQLPLVLPLCYILPTNICYTLSCMAAFERDLIAYRATRRSSLLKRAELVKDIWSHFRTLFFNLEELFENLSLCLDQSYFEEMALLNRQTRGTKAPDQLPGQIILLRRSYLAHQHASYHEAQKKG